MLKFGIDPRYNPKVPPGYVFVSNSSYRDTITREFQTIESIQKKISDSFNIPIEDLITLEKICAADFSTFALDIHKDKIDSAIKYLKQMMEIVEEEYRAKYNIPND